MKLIVIQLFTLIFILHGYFSFSQTWPKYYGEPNRNDYSRDIIGTYDKGYIICGGYNDFAWLIKTDINGNIIWEKILECDGFNYLMAIHQSMDGGILACGVIQNNKADQMPYVLKLNSCGELEWCKSFYTPEPIVLPWAEDIKETESGDIIVLVNTYGDYPEESMHLFKLDSQGNILWAKPFCSGYVHPEEAIPLGESVHVLSDGKYIVCGRAYWEDPWNPGGVMSLRPTFVMVDSLGNEEWVLPFGLADTIRGEAYSLVELQNNEFVGIASYWESQSEITPIFVKFNNAGIELDYKLIDVEDIDPSFSKGHLGEIILIDSVYYLSGTFEIAEGIIPSVDVKFNANLFESEPQIIDHIIHYNQYWPYSFVKTFDNKIIKSTTFKETGNWDIVLSKLNLNLEYDTAYTGNYTYDSLCTTPGQPQSGFIYLDDCDIITGIDIPSPEEYYANMQTIPLTVYPNPVNDRVTFAMENTEHHKSIALKCFNLLGNRLFVTTVHTGQKEASTQVSNWPQGMYVAVVYSDGMPVGQCKFVVK